MSSQAIQLNITAAQKHVTERVPVKLKIQSNVPLPEHAVPSIVSQIRGMQVGQSFFTPVYSHTTAAYGLNACCKGARYTVRVAVEQNKKGWRVFRTK